MKKIPDGISPNSCFMRNLFARPLVILSVLMIGLATTVSAATLKEGDPAPKLQPGKWVQGDPVKEFEKGKAYIIEFWATWCIPCRISIPHLNEIQNKFKGKNLIVIGQNCWEPDDSLVAPFIKKMGDKMTYRVALDDKKDEEKGIMAKTWMEAAGRDGIPTAFLVDTNRTIAWIGHPMELKEEVIEAVLAGKFDAKKYAEQEQKEKEAIARIAEPFQKKDWAAAEAAVADAAKVLSPDRVDILDRIRLAILFGKKDYPAAYKLASRISETHKDDVMLQNELAWRIANDKQIENRDLGVAETIATRANEAAKGEDPTVLDTLSRIKFMRGKTNEAVQLEEKAFSLADANMQPEIRKIIDGYKKGQMPE